MTNIGLVGDVHGNAMAASAAVLKLKEQDADRIIFLGDFGYRFSPSFVRGLDEVSKHTGIQIEWLPGNHEDFNYLEKIDYDLGSRFTCHRTGDVTARAYRPCPCFAAVTAALAMAYGHDFI